MNYILGLGLYTKSRIIHHGQLAAAISLWPIQCGHVTASTLSHGELTVARWQQPSSLRPKIGLTDFRVGLTQRNSINQLD